MSGIVGLVNTDGAPIDRALLNALTESQRFRGPDAQRMWIDGHVGFGHTLFATTDDAWRERQPCSLGADVWIVADARVDGRDDLKRDLASRGCTDLTRANDAELLLHAYSAWGPACVDHLLGDFAFAIWDRRTRVLFCARDHFGAKPFFYAHCRGALIFSNALGCVQRHPAVSGALDERTIGDYLLFSYNMRPEATGFADIQRLAPGHTFTWSAGQPPVLRRYWELSLPAEIHYRKSGEYVEHFQDVFDTAVRDRLRTRTVAVAMSGGLDSSTVAAAVKRVLTSDGEPFDLRAHTVVFDRIIPDEERKYAGLVAAALDIPIEFLAADDYSPYDFSSPRESARYAEPADVRNSTLGHVFWTRMAATSRIAFSGDDADSLLNEITRLHFAGLARGGRPVSLLRALGTYAVWMRRCPPIGLRTTLKRWIGRDAEPPTAMPAWLNEQFVARLSLRERLQQVEEELRHKSRSVRPRAVRTSRIWWRIFENVDAAVTGVPLEFRWPFADKRVVEYLLAIPAVPWCAGKTLLRQAMKGVLPDAVRLRKKAPLAGDPLVDALRTSKADLFDSAGPVAAFHRYVDRHAVPTPTAMTGIDDVYLNMRPVLLDWWLREHAALRGNLPRQLDLRTGAEHGQRHEVETVV